MFEVFQKEQNVGMVGNVQKLADFMRFSVGNPRHFGQVFYLIQ